MSGTSNRTRKAVSTENSLKARQDNEDTDDDRTPRGIAINEETTTTQVHRDGNHGSVDATPEKTTEALLSPTTKHTIAESPNTNPRAGPMKEPNFSTAAPSSTIPSPMTTSQMPHQEVIMDHTRLQTTFHGTEDIGTAAAGAIPTTTTDPKSTTCAFLPHAATGSTLHPNPTAPINDTMADAVGTLNISGHINPTSDNPPTTTSPWHLVTNNHRKQPPADPATNTTHEFGLAFERTTKGNNWSR